MLFASPKLLAIVFFFFCAALVLIGHEICSLLRWTWMHSTQVIVYMIFMDFQRRVLLLATLESRYSHFCSAVAMPTRGAQSAAKFDLGHLLGIQHLNL